MLIGHTYRKAVEIIFLVSAAFAGVATIVGILFGLLGYDLMSGSPVGLLWRFVMSVGFLGLLFTMIPLFQYWFSESRTMKRLKESIGEEMSENEISLFDEELSDRPPYLLANSIDRTVLDAINRYGGEILSIKEYLANRALPPEDFASSLSRLRALGLITIDWEEEELIYLTAMGLDAVNLPTALFASKLPSRIWQYVLEMKTAMRTSSWATVIVMASKALEAALKHKIEMVKEARPTEWEEIEKKSPHRGVHKWSAGKLLETLKALGYFEPGSVEARIGERIESYLEESMMQFLGPDFEHKLAFELVQLRNLVHDKEELHMFGPADAAKCDMYLSFLLQLWYGFGNSNMT